MPIYVYKGYDSRTGAARKGRIDAESTKAARQRLRQKDHVIVSELREETSLAGARKSPALQLFSPRASLTDVAIMTRQFAVLQVAHVPLDESLRALTAQVENPVLRNTLSSIKDLVSEGKSLAEATQAFPGVFNKLFVNMVRAGESSGTLGLVLTRLADYLEYQIKVRGQFIGAITYPAVMLLASGGVIIYLFVSVVPQIAKVFSGLKVVMPWYTRALIAISEFLQNYWFVVMGVIAAALVGYSRWSQTPAGRRKVDGWALTLPAFGPVVLRLNVSQFTKTLSTLLSSGVPIIQSLEITRNVVSNTIVSDVLDKARTTVQEGESLGAVIERSGIFPALVTHMIKTGERTGQLEEMLKHVADAYDEEVERRISGMISLLEPVMLVVMGGITVTVIVSVFMPMMGVMSQLR